MNLGEHPQEEITNAGYLIQCSRLPMPSQWKPKEMSRPTSFPQMQEHLLVHEWYHTVSWGVFGRCRGPPFPRKRAWPSKHRAPTQGLESSNEQTTRDDERETVGPDEIYQVWRLS